MNDRKHWQCTDGFMHAWQLDSPKHAHCSYCSAVLDVRAAA